MKNGKLTQNSLVDRCVVGSPRYPKPWTVLSRQYLFSSTAIFVDCGFLYFLGVILVPSQVELKFFKLGRSSVLSREMAGVDRWRGIFILSLHLIGLNFDFFISNLQVLFVLECRLCSNIHLTPLWELFVPQGRIWSAKPFTI